MSTTSKPPVAAAPPLGNKERLEQVQRDLADLARRLGRSTRLTAIIGGLLLLAVCVYFYLGYKMINDVTQPEQLVNAGQTFIDDALPDAKKKLEKWLIDSAPSFASSLSKAALDALKKPGTREKLADFVVKQFDDGVDQVGLIGEEHFAKFLSKKGPELRKRMKELGNDPKSSDAFYKELVAMLEEEFEVNLRDEAAELLGTLKDANASWRALAIGKDLGDEGKLELQVGLLLRRLYLQEQEPELLKQLDKKIAVAPKVLPPPNTALVAVIKAVDAEKRTLTATVQELDKDVMKTFKMAEKVKVAAAGKPNAAVTDLTEGTRVLLHLTADRQTVEAVTVRKDKAKQKTEK